MGQPVTVRAPARPVRPLPWTRPAEHCSPAEIEELACESGRYDDDDDGGADELRAEDPDPLSSRR